ncbi:MAG: aminotransferase class I/II-fold pyridoxal phosphate-dependent enzyme [Chitinophagales bacterium]|nr:aminotransferase class I/II-fold pyridoxal phosphate-dependent enzyme [Chitinophagales bacterium]
MKKEFSDLINKFFSKSAEMGLIQISTQDEKFDGKHVTVKGKEYVYFGSCSYLGLETDERLKEAAIDAVQRYGSQFSCSRTFLQMGLYEEVESMLSEIFGKPTLLAPTTSLGHISTIPVIMGERDAMIADQQVHNSVRNAMSIAKGEGVYMETVPHNDMETLERRVQILRHDYDRIWYFADGVYSMYGDGAKFTEIWQLLERYEQFHFYVDDAHGMSWTGKHGRGLVLQNMPYHPKMMLTSSLAKGFANCGGVLVFNDEEQKRLIKNCGSSFIFSGPLQPAVLGAIKAAAQIHLSNELEPLQTELFERMIFFVEKARQLGLAVINNELTPIFYVGVGKTEIGFKLINRLKEEGFFCNLAHFPAVSVKNAGLRVALTRHHSLQEISRLLETVADSLPKFMEEENFSNEELFKAFRITPPNQSKSGENNDELRKIA